MTVTVKPKIISLDVTPKPLNASNDVLIREVLNDLLRSGHTVVATPEAASRLWLEATRIRPNSDVNLTRTPGGYRIEVLYNRLV